MPMIYTITSLWMRTAIPLRQQLCQLPGGYRYLPTTDWTEVTSYLNGEEMAVGSCANNGFVVFVIDPVSGYPWQVSEVMIPVRTLWRYLLFCH